MLASESASGRQENCKHRLERCREGRALKSQIFAASVRLSPTWSCTIDREVSVNRVVPFLPFLLLLGFRVSVKSRPRYESMESVLSEKSTAHS